MNPLISPISALKHDIIKRIEALVRERISTNSPYVDLKDEQQIIFTRMHDFPVNQYGLVFQELLWFAIESIGTKEVCVKTLDRSKGFFMSGHYRKNHKNLIISSYRLDINTLFLMWQTLSGNFKARNGDISFD